jgi:hypothetical protein
VPDDVVQQIAGLLGAHVEEQAAAEDEENLRMREDPKIRVGGPRGPVGGQDRRFALDALDQFGQPRRNLATPMPLGGDDRGFSGRFPEAARIRTA